MRLEKRRGRGGRPRPLEQTKQAYAPKIGREGPAVKGGGR
jgi:hypothetical protein